MLRIVAGQAGAAIHGGWMDVVDPTPAEIDRLMRELSIPEAFVRHSLDFDERPRLVIESKATLLVLQIPFVPQGGTPPYETLPLGLILSGDWIVTICPRETEVLEAVRRFAEKDWPVGLHHRLILHTLAVVADTYLTHLSRMAREIDAIEERLSVSLANREVLELLRYQKSLIYYATALRACERLLQRLETSPAFHIPPEDEGLLADVLVEIRQAIDVATVSGNILGEMMDAFASIISNNLNVVMKLLTAVTIVLMVPNIIASLYGMNVGLPGQHSAYAFAMILVVSAVLCVAVAVMFRKRNWL